MKILGIDVELSYVEGCSGKSHEYNRLLGCFHFLAVVQTAAVNTGVLNIEVPVSPSDVVFPECMPSGGTVGSYSLFFKEYTYCSP